MKELKNAIVKLQTLFSRISQQQSDEDLINDNTHSNTTPKGNSGVDPQTTSSLPESPSPNNSVSSIEEFFPVEPNISDFSPQLN